MMKRTPIVELLDSDNGTADEVAGSLADLRWFNRWFGGISTARQMIEQVARTTQCTSLSLLEVAAGSGDVPRAAAASLHRRGIHLQTTLLDRAASHVANSGRAIVGDALALPFRDASFDLVACGLFAHHLSPEKLVQFAKEALRVSRCAFLINDLIRHPIHLALVYAGLPLYRSRLTRHDAPASVRQAYTTDEMSNLLRRAGATRIEVGRHYLFRMGVIAWKA